MICFNEKERLPSRGPMGMSGWSHEVKGYIKGVPGGSLRGALNTPYPPLPFEPSGHEDSPIYAILITKLSKSRLSDLFWGYFG